MAATDEGMFLYDALSPLGDSTSEKDEVEDYGLSASFLPLESVGSPRGEDGVAEQATSSVTVERQETKYFRRVNQKTGGTVEERSLHSLIAAEKDLLAESSGVEFTARADTSGSAGFGVLSTVNAYSVSRTNIQSVARAETEVNSEGTDFISLELGDGNAETLIQEVSQSKGKRVVTLGELNTTPKGAPPWARGRDTWIQSPLLQLHQEIVDFCEFVAPTKDEQLMRATAVQRVSNVVQSIWPSCQVRVFGSFATGLYLPTSDVDVVVLDSGCQARQDGLKALGKALTRNSVGKSIQVIGKARVPIIKFVETHSNIPFDISFDVANGPEAADFIKAAMGAIPPLRPLCLVLKIFLQQRELNEVYQGGIGSYALLVMLLTHLQMHPSKRRASSRDQAPPLESNLGILLVDFLDLYGRTLNMKDVGVSCRGGGRFFPKKERGFTDSKRPHLLCVEDPQSPDNDIGKNSYGIRKVRSAFMMAHRLLTNLNGDNEMGLLSRIVRMDSKLVGRKVPMSLTPTRNLPAKKHHPVTFAGYYHEPIAEPDQDRYVVGNGTFSNSESDDAMNFKTPDRRHRGRWQDYEDDFSRGGDSADGHLSKKARKAKKYKESVRSKDSHASTHFAHDRHRRSPPTPQESSGEYFRKRQRGDSLGLYQNSRGTDKPSEMKPSSNAAESPPEEGEVRLGRRARKREEFLKWKAEKIERESQKVSNAVGSGEEAGNGTKAVARINGHNHHTHWKEQDALENSSKKYSRFREELASSRGSDRKDRMRSELSDLTPRLVITKPAHKKIKYM